MRIVEKLLLIRCLGALVLACAAFGAEKGSGSLLEINGRPIGRSAVGEPWITNVKVVDLDEDGLLDVLVCDGRLNKVSWIRQVSAGEFQEVDIGETIPGPVHTETADIDRDGDLDVLVASMGIVAPNNERIGAVVALENLGGEFRQRVLLDNVPRVTYVNAGDLDGGGDLDLVVGMFGFVDGEIRWLEGLGNWEYASHELLNLSGTIHAPLVDVDGDGDVDIVAVVSQDWEEIHLFENDGKGSFTGRIVYGALNRNFGSSGICVADLDSDGDPDIVYTNGDGLDYATPGPRSWHGVQWLENDGTGNFAYRRIGDLPGAHSPLVVDFNNDQILDVVAVSGFNDWSSDSSASIVYFQQDRDRGFASITLANRPTHLITIDGADMNGDGKIELVTGAFMYYPPFDHKSRVMYWELDSQEPQSDE